MAMHFTVRPARLASSLLLILVYACNSRPATVPPVFKPETDAALHQHEGFLYEGEQHFSGYTYALFPNGDTASITAYFNGKEEGLQRKWYRKNRLMEERWYTAGKKEGVHHGWWPNGKPKFSYHFSGDEYEGELTEWDETGLLYKRMHYTAGHENGLQQMWWPDGKLRANYVIKNGQAYGLIGRKICVNNDTTKPAP